MTAGRWNITMEQGARFSYVIYVRNADGSLVDLTLYVARMIVRDEAGGDKICEFLESGIGNHYGLIVNGGTAGTLTLSMSAIDTAAITEESGYYDLELLPIDSWTAITSAEYTSMDIDVDNGASKAELTASAGTPFSDIVTAEGLIADEDDIYIKVSGAENTGDDANDGVNILDRAVDGGTDPTNTVLTLKYPMQGADNAADTAMTLYWGRSEEDNVVRLLEGSFRLNLEITSEIV